MFCDSNLFDFKEIYQNGKKFHIPVHHRELGEKNGLLYDKKVKWSDVLIHHVPLEYTIRSENIVIQKVNEDIPIYSSTIH